MSFLRLSRWVLPHVGGCFCILLNVSEPDFPAAAIRKFMRGTLLDTLSGCWLAANIHPQKRFYFGRLTGFHPLGR